MSWIDVKVANPDNGQRILVYDRAREVACQTAKYMDGKFYVECDNLLGGSEVVCETVSTWQPMPQVPGAIKAELTWYHSNEHNKPAVDVKVLCQLCNGDIVFARMRDSDHSFWERSFNGDARCVHPKWWAYVP